MKTIKNFAKKLNFTQVILVAIFFPIILIIIALPIAGQINGDHIVDAFNFDDTWWFWLLIVCAITYFEFNLFSDKE